MSAEVEAASAETAAPAPAALSAAGLIIAVGRLRGIEALRHTAAELRGIEAFRHTAAELRGIEAFRHALAPKAGEAGTAAAFFRLLTLRIPAVIALEEAVLHALHREIEAPILAVDRDVDEGAEGRIRAELIHQPVGEIVLHIGVVLDDVVQAQLVQAVIVLPVFILVEFDFEAVSLGTHVSHRRKGGVSLAADRHVFHRFVVDHHAACAVGLAFAGLDEGVPVVDHDINAVDSGGIKQRFLITHGTCGRLESQGLPVHEKEGQEQTEHEDDNADPIDVLMR